ncbi:MAG: aquaporin [Bacteroidetes bacterium]|nr:aquaporin [Bacteroidota bacterium]MBU1373276.1 aquaporin [Bacteroidota bacterium]MBU1486376.1 aquaporin [Bacteroidota bacterium]MBU1761913.1 aquaporin [Bacteroidota bacterium]MBU2046122.1 aquaporin [Bacteroidota bacterium]
MKKYFVEFIGTFFLMLIIVLTVNDGSGDMAPLAIGSILMVMVFAGGHISGGHFNPAVTLGVWICGKVKAGDIPGYMIGQILGSLLGALTAIYLLGFIPGSTPISTGGTFDFIGGTLAEFLGTFALVWVVLHTATAADIKGNSYYGLAIGFTIMACAYGLGGITGGAFNPAVALGISAIGMTSWGNILAFLLGQLLAGVAAAFVFKYVTALSKTEEESK